LYLMHHECVELRDHTPRDVLQDFYGADPEPLPPNAPVPRSIPIQSTAFVDADHAGCSRTGVLIYLNRAPLVWYSKKKNCVDPSTFGAQFIALKTGVKLIKGLGYK
jgi:hypothetical protein